MLAEAQNYLREHHGAARLYVYGQDYNKRAFATAERTISLLRERRAALIAAAVTGQIEIPAATTI